MSRARKNRRLIRWNRYVHRAALLGAKPNWGWARAMSFHFHNNDRNTFMWKPRTP